MRVLIERLMGDGESSREAADAMAVAVARHVVDVFDDVMREKEINLPVLRYEDRVAQYVLKFAAKFYDRVFDEMKAGDQVGMADADDFDTFVREVVTPALRDLFADAGVRHKGFGPKSYISRVKKMRMVPWDKDLARHADGLAVRSGFKGQRGAPRPKKPVGGPRHRPRIRINK